MKTVVIIGAGFCGALTAIHLLNAAGPPLRVILLNRSGLMARGVAYGTRTERHVLNVPAGRMGVLPGDDQGFLRFAQRRLPDAGAHSFLPRQLFGDYIEHLLVEAARRPPSGSSFRAMVGEARRIQRGSSGGLQVRLTSGESLAADAVVLALGHFAPRDPPLPLPGRELLSSPRYVRDPWRPDALWGVRRDEPVLMIGTGLTMLDVMLDLRERGVQAPLYALSRRGLMPLAHRDQDQPPQYRSQLAGRLLATPRIRHWLRAFRAEVESAAAEGVDWRDVIGALRVDTPALWQALPEAERARFLRHLRPYWEVHRHRCAPELGAALAQEQASGGLQRMAGRLLAAEDRLDGIHATLRLRDGSTRQLTVGAVINCTGPEADTRSLGEPLLRSLREAGEVRADALGLGLEVDGQYRLLRRDGQPQPALYYIGPFLRARDWEATAVPELRQHAARLAAVLRQSLSTPAGIQPPDWVNPRAAGGPGPGG